MTKPTIAVVIIGRNEGERLVRCFASVQDAEQIVYVDSGSTDGSVAAAHAAGAKVVELDLSHPFTAARARNAGINVLRLGSPPDLIQFVDGDCELQPGWLLAAAAFLLAHPRIAVVSGRLRERFPDVSIYNRLCDREWDTPTGRVRSCGGIAMMRRKALDQTGGFNPSLIAGEEPELCVRLRAKGWEIWRIDAEMALHDAAMTRFSQWWKRERRAGYAYAEGAALHGAPPERHGVRGVWRAMFWGVVIPLTIGLMAVVVSPWALLLLLVYPAQVTRLTLKDSGHRHWKYAFFDVLVKFPQSLGCLQYFTQRLHKGPAKLIEYK